MSAIYQTLSDAIARKQCVRMMYHDHERRCCPHILGRNPEDVLHVLVFQYAGGSASGLPPDGAWRCMRLDALSAVSVIAGPWRTGPTEGNPPPKCVTQVEVEVKP